MEVVEISDAQRRFEQLVEAIASGQSAGFILARNGQPAVMLVDLSPDEKLAAEQMPFVND